MKRKINIVLLIIVILILIYLGYLFFTKYAFKREEIEKKENIEEYGPTTVYFEGYYYNMLGNCYGMVSGKENEYVLRIYDNKANWGGVVIIVDKNTFADDSFEDFDKIESGLINRGKNISNKKVTSKGEYNILNPSDKLNDYFCPSNTAGYGSIVKGDQNSTSYNINDLSKYISEYYVVEVR